jgi:putative ABC transport system ATP-binding protein
MFKENDMSKILQTNKLCKKVTSGKGTVQKILKNVDFSVDQGEFVSVMGPSGSGKSTLLYNISGMDRMTSGSVEFNGKELSGMTEQDLSKLRLHEMGFIFQHIYLLKNLNIFDNIILSARLAKRENHSTIRERALRLLKQTGIEELVDHDITQASGGQLQRVGICRSLINNPQVIFGDEPTGALNSRATQEIMELIGDINQSGTTVMIATHDVKVAARSERVLYMLDGEMIGQKRIGKYDKKKKNERQREEQLTCWLEENGL